MAIDPTLLTLAEELADESDLDLDMTRGSAFRTTFVDPLLTRAGGNPLDVDLEGFLVERLETEIENIDVTTFSAMRDLVIRAFVAMVQPLQREIEGVKLTQSLDNYESMTRAELNALLANYFTSLEEGSLARGTVRVYYPTPQSATVTPVTQFSTGAGLNFFPITVQQISSTQMNFQQEGELYYFDVLVEAENAGDEYNIDADEINRIFGVSGVTRVTNRSRFTSGLAEETKAEGVARTQDSITIRNLITARGVAFVIPENFPTIDTLQIIGFGDDEMLRDIVSGDPGPVDVSEIPGGLRGEADPDLVSGEHIHIGGKTDVYVYQETPDEEDLDIEDLTDKGYQVFAGIHGYTNTGGPQSIFNDDYGHFLKRGVVGTGTDYLLLDDGEYQITSVTPGEVGIVGTIDPDMSGKTYEIVRKVAGYVTVPLYDLVAVDDSGTPVITSSGLPAMPIPGSATNEVLLDSLGDPVEKTDNVSSENVELPLLRATEVEFLDPLTKEPLGQIIPMMDLLLAKTIDGLENVAAPAVAGQIRHYFRDAVNCWVTYASTRYTSDVTGDVYRPIQQVVETGIARIADLASEEIILDDTGSQANGNYTALIAIGDRVTVDGKGPFLVIDTDYFPGSKETVLTVRENLADYWGGPAPIGPFDIESHAGILEANMSLDSDTGLYYVEFDVELMTGTGEAEGTSFTAVAVNSEGWSIKTTKSVYSYSTREKPYLQVTTWVNDTSQLFVTFTAPAIRISYEYAGTLSDIQAFADDDANRIVAEDVLIRHFVPSYVRGSWTVRELTSLTGQETIVEYIDALDPTEDLEVSDVVDALYEVGATYVMLPVTMTKLTQNRDRTWTGYFDQDTLGSSRIQHFRADIDVIVVTETT